MTDERLDRSHTVNGRIAVFWNRARYVEVLKRTGTKPSWMITERFIEITEPRHVYHAQNLNDRSNIESCEFHSVQIPVRPEWRGEFPGEGWGVRLWDSQDHRLFSYTSTALSTLLRAQIDCSFLPPPDLRFLPMSGRQYLEWTPLLFESSGDCAPDELTLHTVLRASLLNLILDHLCGSCDEFGRPGMRRVWPGIGEWALWGKGLAVVVPGLVQAADERAAAYLYIWLGRVMIAAERSAW